ncbi:MULTISPECIES: hypothetical protein [Methylobacterium]|uniref:Uncharacterized protein n=1 Tax=Methylobacterium persicinum TaxID=374426 RepID=A0ABU0HSX2_9HYPH|nr:hypothetical protein [Methylobacterium persicinum]MDQ0445428.1 hypothetical protein [Methylobacterium persicinum]
MDTKKPISRPELDALIKRARKQDRRLGPFLRRERADLIPLIGTHYIDRKLLMLIVKEAGLTNAHGDPVTPGTASATWKAIVAERAGLSRDDRYRGRRRKSWPDRPGELSARPVDVMRAVSSPTPAQFPPGILVDEWAEPAGRSDDTGSRRDEQGQQKLRKLRAGQHDTERPLPPILKRRRM